MLQHLIFSPEQFQVLVPLRSRMWYVSRISLSVFPSLWLLHLCSFWEGQSVCWDGISLWTLFIPKQQCDTYPNNIWRGPGDVSGVWCHGSPLERYYRHTTSIHPGAVTSSPAALSAASTHPLQLWYSQLGKRQKINRGGFLGKLCERKKTGNQASRRSL